MVMEAAAEVPDRISFEMAGHSGDNEAIIFSAFDRPPRNEKERHKIIQRMIASSQYCSSGDRSLKALAAAAARARARCTNEGDEAIVLAFSDANLRRYNIGVGQVTRVLDSLSEVQATLVLIGNQNEAAQLAAQVPAAVAALETAELPNIVRNVFQGALGAHASSPPLSKL